MQQFSPWIAGFPGLIWSIDIPHSRLKVFNRWSIPGLELPVSKDAVTDQAVMFPSSPPHN